MGDEVYRPAHYEAAGGVAVPPSELRVLVCFAARYAMGRATIASASLADWVARWAAGGAVGAGTCAVVARDVREGWLRARDRWGRSTAGVDWRQAWEPWLAALPALDAATERGGCVPYAVEGWEEEE